MTNTCFRRSSRPRSNASGSTSPRRFTRATATGSARSIPISARFSIRPATSSSPKAKPSAGWCATVPARSWGASRRSTTARRPHSKSSPRAAADSSSRSTTSRSPTCCSKPRACGWPAAAWRPWTARSTSDSGATGGGCWSRATNSSPSTRIPTIRPITRSCSKTTVLRIISISTVLSGG